jgi:hypothetical protein
MAIRGVRGVVNEGRGVSVYGTRKHGFNPFPAVPAWGWEDCCACAPDSHLH